MPKNDDLSLKSPFGPEQRDHEACQELQTIDHPAADYPIRGRKPLRMKFSVGTRARSSTRRPCLQPHFLCRHERGSDPRAVGHPRSWSCLVGRQPRRLLHRSARARRRAGDAPLLPRAPASHGHAIGRNRSADLCSAGTRFRRNRPAVSAGLFWALKRTRPKQNGRRGILKCVSTSDDDRDRVKTPYRNDNEQLRCAPECSFESFVLLGPRRRLDISPRSPCIGFSHSLDPNQTWAQLIFWNPTELRGPYRRPSTDASC